MAPDHKRARFAMLASAEHPVPAYSEALRAGDALIAEQFRQGLPPEALVRTRAELVDQLLGQAWRRFVDAGDRVALIAVGGYGRGELHPHSDIDVLIVVDEALEQPEHVGIGDFLRLLWDIGLKVGHSVRTLSDCESDARAEIATATNLLETRLLAGSHALHRKLRRLAMSPEIWTSREFFKAKLDEQKRRYAKYQNSAYRLEPNVKESPGGLRDVQLIGWIAKRHFHVSTLEELVNHGFMTPQEFSALRDGQRFLWRVRYALHLLAGRAEDRLLFEFQRQLAEEFGHHDENKNRSVEAFMQVYYRTVMALERLCEMLLQHFREAILYTNYDSPPEIVHRRFLIRHGFLEVRDREVFRRYPPAILELFLTYQQEEVQGIRASTVRLLREHIHLIDGQFRADPINRRLFLDILRQPRRITDALKRMNRYGVLAAYMPAFERIVGRMQFDLFHIYTVDEHILTVVRNLRRFAVPEHADEFPLCSRLFRRVRKPEVLYLAALFHDIAKGRGGDHSEDGAEDATQFCRHHGLLESDVNTIAWLVQQHLLMSLTAQKRDISDPVVVAEFANEVGTLERLELLYLLTVADIRATNPKLWNDWKHTLLLQLFHASRQILETKASDQALAGDDLSGKRAKAVAELVADGRCPHCDEATLRRLWNRLGEEYLRHYRIDQITWHSRELLGRMEGGSDVTGEPIVLIRPAGQGAVTEIFVYTVSGQQVFATLCEALEKLGLDIVDAQACACPAGCTLLSFLVLETDGNAVDDGFRSREIHDQLDARLRRAEVSWSPPTRQRVPRQLRAFDVDTVISFSQDPRNQRTIVHVVARDRPGLLSCIGQALVASGLRLHSARAATLGEKADDLFTVTDGDGEPITEAEQLTALERTLTEFIDQPVIEAGRGTG